MPLSLMTLVFQSTSLSRGKTSSVSGSGGNVRSFNPLPSHEGRRSFTLCRGNVSTFQSTSLSRGKTKEQGADTVHPFLSIHFPLTREDAFYALRLIQTYLSIHFPLTREDLFTTCYILYIISFNPLPSHEGRQNRQKFRQKIYTFNPLPSHEGRPMSGIIISDQIIFQSTSLSRGKTVLVIVARATRDFQSTSLSRGKTFFIIAPWSISRSFNPLPSHEGRLVMSA